MAQVEIYKLKKTIDPEVREYGMFEFFGMVNGPLPQNYVREWAGELDSGSLETLYGRFALNPPDGYHGGPLDKSDIAVVDGVAYFLDRESGYKFAEVDFDASAIKDAIHVDYGYHVAMNDAVQIDKSLGDICESLDIPVGYLSEPDYHGIHKGNAPFQSSPSNRYAQPYLHPYFLKGDEARAFAGLLEELSKTDTWQDIEGYLHENYPVYVKDLETARERFTPELLLPAELRSLSNHIPTDSDKSELAYLAEKIAELDDKQRNVFDAVIEAGWYCGSVAAIINLTENLDHFELHPDYDAESYGAYRLEQDWANCAALFQRFKRSEDPMENALAKYIALLEQCTEKEIYGVHAAKRENGAFTKYGLITEHDGVRDVYLSIQDLPDSYRATEPPVAAEKTENQLVMVNSTDLAALLLEMHAIGGGYMHNAKYNLNTLAAKGDDFFVMANSNKLVVSPADLVFRGDTHEHELWMMANKMPDIHVFVMSITDRNGGQFTGNLFEADIWTLQDYIRDNSFWFTHLDAEMKDGTIRRFSDKEWDAMGLYDRGPVLSLSRHYDPADEARLAAFLSGLRWAFEENSQPVTAQEFLSELNGQYMAQANYPQPDMLRIAPEAAKEMLAQNAAEVLRLVPGGTERLSPIDAIKVTTYQSYREFAVHRMDIAGIEKWAQRTAADVLRQNERGQQDKSKNKEER